MPEPLKKLRLSLQSKIHASQGKPGREFKEVYFITQIFPHKQKCISPIDNQSSLFAENFMETGPSLVNHNTFRDIEAMPTFFIGPKADIGIFNSSGKIEVVVSSQGQELFTMKSAIAALESRSRTIYIFQIP